MKQWKLVVGLALFALPLGARADQPPRQPTVRGAEHVMLKAADLRWVAAPNYLPRGAQVAALHGSMDKPGMFVVQIKFPANYKIPAHYHSGDEHITVISGSVSMGMGEREDDAGLKTIDAGGYALMPAKQVHYLKTSTDAIVQRTAVGPFRTTYVRAADDPRRIR